MSHAQRSALMKQRLSRVSGLESLDENLVKIAFYIEKKLHIEIGPEYPVAKFIIVWEELEEFNKREREEYDRTKGIGKGGVLG